jgi:uncharacterized protein YjbI with pentapeptide repeats
MPGKRRTWKESWKVVRKRGVRLPGKSGDTADVCNRPERGEEGFPGLCFREKTFEETDFTALRLPRTLFLRCRFAGVSFHNTDMRLSCLADCDWIDCDFTDADLVCCDLRGAELFGCRFVNARLVGADLAGADLTGAKLDRKLKATLALSDLQRDRMVDWFDPKDEGPDEGDEDE